MLFRKGLLFPAFIGAAALVGWIWAFGEPSDSTIWGFVWCLRLAVAIAVGVAITNWLEHRRKNDRDDDIEQ
jgi:predicted outer membrane lipoprotein